MTMHVKDSVYSILIATIRYIFIMTVTVICYGSYEIIMIRVEKGQDMMGNMCMWVRGSVNNIIMVHVR